MEFLEVNCLFVFNIENAREARYALIRFSVLSFKQFGRII